MQSPEKFCDMHSNDITKQCFVKEVIASLAHSPNQLAVDKLTNSLYFSFDSGQGEYIPGRLHIGENGSLVILKGVKDAFAVANDADTGTMYFGGSHGIYKYDPVNKTLKRLAINNLDIWWLVIKKNIYFIKFPSLTAYRYENKTIKHVSQLRNHSVHQFVFDMDDNIFFINNTGLYGVKNGDYNAVLIRDYPRFLGMATDNNGYVYVCSEDGIFIVSKLVQKVKRIISIQGVLGLTFDKHNNLIYSDSHEIVRLVPVSKEDYYATVTMQ